MRFAQFIGDVLGLLLSSHLSNNVADHRPKPWFSLGPEAVELFNESMCGITIANASSSGNFGKLAIDVRQPLSIGNLEIVKSPHVVGRWYLDIYTQSD
jgi:hypothetical protein